MKTTSCLAGLMDESCRAIARYLSHRLGLPVKFVDDLDWQERYRQLDRGEFDLAWICGAPYVRRVAHNPNALEPLVAPVWQGERYAGRACYFSDLVVRADSALRTFADLRGATWVYNEPGSFSGFEAMRYHLAIKGLPGDYFGRVITSGAHQRSLELIQTAEADVSAIDSTVLDALRRRRSPLVDGLKVVDIIGPSPMPPWVIARHVPSEIRQAIRQSMLSMANDVDGQAILAHDGIDRFIPVTDSDYEATRLVLKLAEAIAILPV